jgi:hypothetical protein
MADPPRPFFRPRVWRSVSAVLALAAVAGVGYLYWWSDDPRVRYARMACYYNQIYTSAGPVDITLQGTSRMKYGVESRALAESLGMDPATAAVVNMGRGGRGTGQMYQQLVDLDRERGIRGPIIVEYTPSDSTIFTPEPLYYHYKATFPTNVTFDALLEDWRSKPREPAYAKARDLLDHLQYRLDTTLETGLVGIQPRIRSVPPEEREAKGVQTCMSNPTSRVVRRWGNQAQTLERRAERVQRRVGDGRTWRDQEPLEWDIGVVNQDRQSHYIDAFVRFARERDLPIAVVLIPGYLEPPPSERFLTAFEERFGVPLIAPPLPVLEELNADDGRLFQDANHLNRRGYVRFAEWLAADLRDRFGAAASGGAPPPT